MIAVSLVLVAAVLMMSTPVFAENPPGDAEHTGADNPLTTSVTLSGNLDVVVDVVHFSYATNPSGTFTISGIPSGSTIVKALVYHQEWEFSAGETALSWLAGVNLGTISPFTHDPAGGDDLAIYRWDVTPLVTGDGSYAFTTSGLERVFGAALVVVYSNLGLPLSEVRINDGAESMANGATASTSFSGVAAGSGRLIIYTEADNNGGHGQTGETISFNGGLVGGPIDQNLGAYASLFDISVNTVSGTNTADIYTPTDYFGWHLAILVSPRAEGVPEFGLTMTITTSLAAAIYLFIRKRLFKRED